MLARLSVFAGGCTLDAAEAVCAFGAIDEMQVIGLVSSLVARSLVAVDVDDAEERSYRLLETIRQYAEERLDPHERAEARERHARYYAGWLAAASAHLRGPDQTVWVGRADREVENVRAAVGWALEQADESLAFDMLNAAVWPPIIGLPIGRALSAAAGPTLELARADQAEHLAYAVAFAAFPAFMQGDLGAARGLLAEARALDDSDDDDLNGLLAALENNLALWTGDVVAAMEANARGVVLARRTGQRFFLANALAGLSAQHATSGDFETARAEADEAVAVARQLGAPSALTMAHAALAFAMVGTDPDGAREQLRALTAPGALVRWSDGSIESALATMMVCAARLDEVEAELVAASRVLDSTPSTPLFLGVVLETVAAVLASRAPDDAATLRGAADTIVPGFSDVVALRGNVTEPEGAAYELGRRMTEDEAAVFARDLIRDALTTERAAP